MTCLCAALPELSIAGPDDTRDKNQYLEPNNRRNKMSLPVSMAVLALPFGEHFRRHQLMRNDRCCKCEWTDGSWCNKDGPEGRAQSIRRARIGGGGDCKRVLGMVAMSSWLVGILTNPHKVDGWSPGLMNQDCSV